MLGWFCHIDPGKEAPEGVMGGVEVDCITKEGEPRASKLIDIISNEEAPFEYDLGEGTADPVDAYKGRSSSGLCAKKHTLLVQPVSSLQRRVRYWAG